MKEISRYDLYIKLANKEYMARQRGKGLTCRQIAEEIGCSTHTVEKWLRAHGLREPKAIVHDPKLADRLSKIK